jgi:hypothetical protein
MVAQLAAAAPQHRPQLAVISNAQHYNVSKQKLFLLLGDLAELLVLQLSHI